MQPQPIIRIRGARTHNLKNVNVDFKRGSIIVVTGVSGSGKSSLAFDTLYAEGQRRYVESLSVNSRQFLPILPRPDVDLIDGLSPSIAIEQKSSINNPRSIVGTITDIYDHLRVLFARTGTPFCPNHQEQSLESRTVAEINDEFIEFFSESKLSLYSRVIENQKIDIKNFINEYRAKGYVRIRVKSENDNFRLLDIDKIDELERYKKYTIDVMVDRLKIKTENKERLSESIESCFRLGNGLLVAVISNQDSNIRGNLEDEKVFIYSSGMTCPKCNFTMHDFEPSFFSFNKPEGACFSCKGIGEVEVFDPEKIVEFSNGSLSSGAIPGWDKRNKFNFAILEGLSKKYNFSLDTPFNQLPHKIKNILLFGDTPRVKNSFLGIIDGFEKSWEKSTLNEFKNRLKKFRSIKPCKACKGSRLNNNALSVKINFDGNYKNIFDLVNLPLCETLKNLQNINMTHNKKQAISFLLDEITNRINFLIDIGLNYLTLSRGSSTLSGGELQRIRLATQIGAKLSGVLYVLDEPSIGLHQRDNHRLIKALKKLRNLGNTVVVVEHDEEIIRAADQVIDVGPGAGQFGGKIVFSGIISEMNKMKSLTVDYLMGKKKIEIPTKRKLPDNRWFKIFGARGNNLKKINLKIPVGKFICVTGVSGSGKSSLVHGVISKAIKSATKKNYYTESNPKFSELEYDSCEGFDFFENVISVNQKPIGKTPRSNPATYLNIFNYIREIYSSTRMSKERGYTASRFSFNLKGGRCESCRGDGLIKLEMHFLPDAFVECDSCKGQRFNRETLDIRWRGKNIFDVLSMTVEEAHRFFFSNTIIEKKLKTLIEIGLNYIKLGQSATTLSGGEAQRIKLASEIYKPNSGNTIYILDEPTTGLHFHDVSVLIKALLKLRNQGNTILVVEHNLDVIKTADWIIDMGPEGGLNGGKIICEGPPESVSSRKDSYTAKYLKRILG